MKVRILVHNRRVGTKGELRDVPDTLARSWIDSRYAEEVGEDAKPKKQKPGVSVVEKHDEAEGLLTEGEE